MDTLATFTMPGIGLLLTIGFGLWVSLAGKPYNGILFNIHKLIALGVVIVTTVQFYPMLQNTEVPALLYALVLFVAVCVVALFASGALMSLNKPPYDLLRALHTLTPFLMAIALAVIIYFLTGRPL